MKNYREVKLFDENMENLDEKIEQIVELRRQEALERDREENNIGENEIVTVSNT